MIQINQKTSVGTLRSAVRRPRRRDPEIRIGSCDLHGVRQQVTITYPRWWVWPGYALHPAAALLLGLLGVLASALWVVPLWRAVPTANPGLWFFFLPALVVAVRGVVEIVFGMVDLFVVRVARGQIIKVWRRPPLPFTDANKRITLGTPEKPYVAIADGSRERVRAWGIRDTKLTAVVQGDLVTVRYTPLLRHVRSVELVAPGGGLRPETLGPDVAALEQSTGVRFEVIRTIASAGMPTRWELAAPPSGEVVVQLGWQRDDILTTPHLDVDGADDAYWFRARSKVLAVKGVMTVVATANLPGRDEPLRQRVAIAAAASFLRSLDAHLTAGASASCSAWVGR